MVDTDMKTDLVELVRATEPATMEETVAYFRSLTQDELELYGSLFGGQIGNALCFRSTLYNKLPTMCSHCDQHLDVIYDFHADQDSHSDWNRS